MVKECKVPGCKKRTVFSMRINKEQMLECSDFTPTTSMNNAENHVVMKIWFASCDFQLHPPQYRIETDNNIIKTLLCVSEDI